jgi:hypothetical protein
MRPLPNNLEKKQVMYVTAFNNYCIEEEIGAT